MKTYLHTDGWVIREDELKEVTLPKAGDRLRIKHDMDNAGLKSGNVLVVTSTEDNTLKARLKNENADRLFSLGKFSDYLEPIPSPPVCPDELLPLPDGAVYLGVGESFITHDCPSSRRDPKEPEWITIPYGFGGICEDHHYATTAGDACHRAQPWFDESQVPKPFEVKAHGDTVAVAPGVIVPQVRSTTYYRNLIVECGEAIGKEAYTCDDGTVQQDVLAAKVPELVKALVEKREETADLIYGIMRDEVNDIDECEKWLRAYAPEKLRKAYDIYDDSMYDDSFIPEDDLKRIMRRKKLRDDFEASDHTEGGAYRHLDYGESIEEGDQIFDTYTARWCDIALSSVGRKAGGFLRPLPRYYRRPVAQEPGHTEGGKYRMLEEGEPVYAGDEFLEKGSKTWTPAPKRVFGQKLCAVDAGRTRRPVEPDHAQQAKDILQGKLGPNTPMFRDTSLDAFVDLIIKAAKP